MRMRTTLKKMTMALLATATLALGAAGAARANEQAAAAAKADIEKTLGFVPRHLQQLPPTLLPGMWDELKTLELNPNTALPGRTKELIGLGVSAQVPCKYCVVAHTEFARLHGATEAQIGEAVAMAVITRHWSTFLNGVQVDEAKFRAEVGKVVENAKRAATAKAGAPGAASTSVDGAGALREATAALGLAPEFLRRFPDVARGGAWMQLRDVELNPKSALSGKEKELIGLAVSAQIPCKYCVVAHTEYARLHGASDAEIDEALAMAAVTRGMSTALNGLQADEGQFRKDVERIVKGARASAGKGAKAAAPRQVKATHTAGR